MLKSIENKADHKMRYNFVNGYTLSVIWDSGAYGSNHGHMFVKPIEAATQVEIAVFGVDGKLTPINFTVDDVTGLPCLELNTENCSDTIAPWVDVKHLPFLLEMVGSL